MFYEIMIYFQYEKLTTFMKGLLLRLKFLHCGKLRATKCSGCNTSD